MNPLEHQLQYPFNDTLPAAGTSIEVAPGIRWVRLPLPFALDHINVWLMRDTYEGRDGWTVVDCGVARDEVMGMWEQVFANELDGLPVVRVIVTHMHPDHIGLAHWLTEKWNAPLQMTMTDFVVAQLYCGADSGGGGERLARHFERHGMTNPEDLDGVRKRKSYYSQLVPKVPSSFIRIVDNDIVPIGGHDWQVIIGYGHAPEHASFYSKSLNVVISGDMVLPRISTNVSVNSEEPQGNALQDYLDSLSRYADVPDDALTLPSHGRPFVGIHTRIQQQHDHHAEHLARVLTACAEPKSAFDIVPVLFKRKLDLHQMTFALGESIAHLHMLMYAGRAKRITGEDGVIRFQAV